MQGVIGGVEGAGKVRLRNPKAEMSRSRFFGFDRRVVMDKLAVVSRMPRELSERCLGSTGGRHADLPWARVHGAARQTSETVYMNETLI